MEHSNKEPHASHNQAVESLSSQGFQKESDNLWWTYMISEAHERVTRYAVSKISGDIFHQIHWKEAYDWEEIDEDERQQILNREM